jgi:ABC-type transport system involved in multi-copper enzyme maturation permease subunit
MGEARGPAGAPELLYYRPWRGAFRRPAAAVWPVARVALGMMLRRRLFWGVYGLGLVIFAMFFFGQYLLAWAEGQMGESEVPVAGARVNPRFLVDMLRTALKLNGTGETYHVYIHYQMWILTVLLALAGAILIGNDLRFGSLPFYLSKPIDRRHYLLGKGLAVAVCVNLLTTLPALALYVQWGLLSSWEYFLDHADLLAGILAYGAVLSATLTLLLLATAVWLRRTVPLIMAWATLFYFCRQLAYVLVDGLGFRPAWRLVDLWNDTSLVGGVLLGIPTGTAVNQPAWYDAALVLGGVSLLCLGYLALRIRAVEIVR